jgi:sterol desaturase/sphingolipid hydroxylase (fatty acid hydroxylase superfamily)
LVINLWIGWIDGWTGASRHGLVSGWPIAAQVAFFVISHDLYIYWFHRLQHGNRWLWRLHEAHHSAHDVDWIAGARSHSFEGTWSSTGSRSDRSSGGRPAATRPGPSDAARP